MSGLVAVTRPALILSSFVFFFLLFDLRTHLHIYIHSYTERAVEVGERKKRKERKLKSRTQPEIFRVVFISNVLHYVYAAQRVRLEAILIFAVFIDFNVLFFFLCFGVLFVFPLVFFFYYYYYHYHYYYYYYACRLRSGKKEKQKRDCVKKIHIQSDTMCVCVRGSCQDCDFQRKRENKTTKKKQETKMNNQLNTSR